MRRFNQALITFLFVCGNNLTSYAAGEYRPDKMLLKGIVEFIQYCGFLVLAIGIGTLALSIKDTDGPLKSKALKVIGISIGLILIERIALIFNLI